MEFLEGMSLDDLIEKESQSLMKTRTALIVGAVARALTDAHSKGSPSRPEAG